MLRRIGFAFTALAIFVVTTRSQGPATARILIDRTAPPPIQRGISPVLLRRPGTPEAAVTVPRTFRARALDRRGAGGLHYVAGRVIVKFRDSASTATRVSAVQTVARTGALAARAPNADFDTMTLDPSEDAEAAAAALRQRSDVEYAQAAYRVHPAFVPNDPFFPQQWNLNSQGLNMPLAWDVQQCSSNVQACAGGGTVNGKRVVVAVLDTGVAFANATFHFHAGAFVNDQGVSYPALGDLTLAFAVAPELAPSTRFVSPHDFIWNDSFPVDMDGHGTHVSGTLGQTTNNASGTAGVAFNVEIMPVKVLDTDWDDIFDSPNAGTDDIVALGIRYAADNGANVINMSLGRTGPANCGTNPSQSGCAPAVEAAIKYAVGKGVFVAIAAGNGFDSGNPTEVIAEIANRVPGAVSVASVTEDRTHASYSSTGSYIELSAPGGDFGPSNNDSSRGILQQTLDIDNFVATFDLPPAQYTAPRFDVFAFYFFTGTSQATPHVSGTAAMLMQQGITDPAAVEAILEQTAVDLGTTGRDSTFGFGLINPPRALRGLGLAR